jgi:hypothetical protein
MSNHTHLVVCVNKDMADGWSMEEVVRRWHQLYQGTLLSQKYQRGGALSKGELISLEETVTIYRQRLYDISWLMRNLNEYIAREANKEDGLHRQVLFAAIPGAYTLGQLKLFSFIPDKFSGKDDSNLKPAFMTIRDESAVLACMAYVDLNPIRAKMEVTPETSKHTSIRNRIQALIKGEQPKNLMRFVGNHRQDMPKGIAYSLIDYCELVDCTGRCIREDKAGYIEEHHSPILACLGLDSEQWLTLTTEFEQHFSTAVGSEHMLQQFKHHTDHQRIRGMTKARVLLQRA